MVRRTQKKEDPKSPIPKNYILYGWDLVSLFYLEKFMKTFETYAPGYEQRLWGDDDITKNFPITYNTIKKVRDYQGEKVKEYTNQKTMLKTTLEPYTYSKYAQVADLMRYEIVNTHGGYYFDANMFLLKDISKLFNRKEKFVGCNELE